MLRWCWPTVRALGGRGRVASDITRTSSSFGFARKLVNDRVPWSLRNNIPELVELDALVKVGSQLDNNMEGRDGRVRSMLDKGVQEASEVVSEVARTSPPPLADMYGVDEPEAAPAERRPVSLLKAFLAPTNLTAHEPTKHTANTIRSIYTSAKSRTTLHDLSATDFSALISLFGSLSMSTPDNLYHSLFASPHLANVWDVRERSYWPFVAQLGGDKRRLRLNLQPSDHYWLMCAGLAEMVDAIGRGGEVSSKVDRIILNARHHFTRLHRNSLHPRAYLPYLLSLFHQPTIARANEAAEIIFGLISRQSYTDSPTLDVLWQLVAHYGHLVSSPQRNQLVRAIASRTRTTYKPHLSLDTRHTHDDTLTCNVHDLVCALTTVLSCNSNSPPLASSAGLYLRRWAVESMERELGAAPSSHVSVEAAWRKLQHLAIVELRSKAVELMDTSVQPWSDWSAVCILTQLEQTVSTQTATTESPSLSDDEMRSALCRLWHAWSMEGASAEGPVSDAILASILHLAGDLEAHVIVHQYQMYASQGRIPVGLAARIEGYAAMLLCGQDPGQIAQVTLAEEHPPRSRGKLLRGILLRLLSRDAGLACTFYGILESALEEVPPDATCSFASKLASIGQLGTALTLVTQRGLDVAQRLEIINGVFAQLARVDHAFPLRQFYVDLREAVGTAISPSPLVPPKDLERNILILLKAHRSPGIIKIIETLYRSELQLSDRFLRSAGRQLVFRRHYKLAVELLRGRVSRRDKLWLLLRLSRGGASRLAQKTWVPHKKDEKWASTVEKLLHTTQFKYSAVDTVATLAASRIASKPDRVQDTVFTYQSLLSSGRTRAARSLFERTKDQLSEADRTAMANSLIDHSSTHKSHKQARGVRKSLKHLRELVQGGFVPNRVTINILMKTMLQWSVAVDAEAVRALFDRIIRSGYPVGDKYPAGVGPFGTDAAAASNLPEVPQMASPICFARHVRPLYKMFVKAMFKRGDIMGAKLVVGILRELEAKERTQYARHLYRHHGRKRGRDVK